MIRGSITTVAIVFVLAGAMLLAGPVFGFTTLVADRGMQVDTADDESALLGMTAAEEPTIERTETQTDIATLGNNFGSQLTDLDVRVELDTTDLTWDDSTVPETLANGSTVDLRLECTQESGGITGTAEADVIVDRASTGTVAVEGVSLRSIQVEYDCRPGGGQGPGGNGFTTRSASSLFASSGQPQQQTFTFQTDGTLGSQETVEIDLSTPQAGIVDYSGATVADVDGSGSGNVGSAELVGDDLLVFDPNGNVDQEVTITVEGVVLESEDFAFYPVVFERPSAGGTSTTYFFAVRY